jgi:hypothetical protein
MWTYLRFPVYSACDLIYLSINLLLLCTCVNDIGALVVDLIQFTMCTNRPTPTSFAHLLFPPSPTIPGSIFLIPNASPLPPFPSYLFVSCLSVRVAPYQIALHDGRLIFAPQDSDNVIRLRPPPEPDAPSSPEIQIPGDDVRTDIQNAKRTTTAYPMTLCICSNLVLLDHWDIMPLLTRNPAWELANTYFFPWTAGLLL